MEFSYSSFAERIELLSPARGARDLVAPYQVCAQIARADSQPRGADAAVEESIESCSGAQRNPAEAVHS